MLCVFEQQNVDELGLVHMKTRQVVAIDVKNLNHQAPNLFALLWYVVVVPIVVSLQLRKHYAISFDAAISCPSFLRELLMIPQLVFPFYFNPSFESSDVSFVKK